MRIGCATHVAVRNLTGREERRYRLEARALERPASRFLHTVRYHGIFAGRAKHRKALVALLPKSPHDQAIAVDADTEAPAKRPSRHLWAHLLKRVFAEDLLLCPCGERRKVIGSLSRAHTPEALAAFLTAIGQPTEPLSIAPAQPSPQQDFYWDTPAADPCHTAGRASADLVYDDFAQPSPPDFD